MVGSRIPNNSLEYNPKGTKDEGRRTSKK